MRDAVIVSTARTPIGRAYRGAFNNTDSPSLGGHAIRHAVQRAGIAADSVEEAVMGCSMPQGTQGKNMARQCALAGGLAVADSRPLDAFVARTAALRCPSRVGPQVALAPHLQRRDVREHREVL